MGVLQTVDGVRMSLADGRPAAIPCFRCGVCCVKWQPLLDPAELRRVAADLGVSPRSFNRRYTRPYPLRRGWRQFSATSAGCVFLGTEGGRSICTIHAVRPQVCRDWEAALDKRECRRGLAAHPAPGLLQLAILYDEPADAAALAGAVDPRPAGAAGGNFGGEATA